MKSWQEILDVLKKKLISLGDVTITPAVLITVVLILLGAFGYHACCGICYGVMCLDGRT